MLKKIFAVLITFLLLRIIQTNVYAQKEQENSETLETKVINVLEESELGLTGFGVDGQDKQLYQKLELLVTKGSLVNEKIVVESGNVPAANIPKYEVGDKLIVEKSIDFEGRDIYFISDYIRRDGLVVLFYIFIASVLLVGHFWGATSLLGMGFSFLVIFKFILPQILKGSDPILIATVGSFFIVPFTFYLSHGFNKKTSVAIAGTTVGIIITALLAAVFVSITKLTGFSTEEAGFLQVETQGQINVRGLILAGIIIGALGVLDDVTVSQSAIVEKLKFTNKKLSFGKLYSESMKVGRDHISSMVNTLVLVYTGAAMPLLLLFADSTRSFTEIINYEIVAEEVVRTLVGSVGLVLAVPITTILASYVFERDNKLAEPRSRILTKNKF